MGELIMVLAILAWYASLAPPYVWISEVISLVHILDEVALDPNTIWDYLMLFPPYLPSRVLMLGYVLVFVPTILLLPFTDYAWLLILVRVGDFLITHNLLHRLGGPSPGRNTKYLLLVDAAILFYYLRIY